MIVRRALDGVPIDFQLLGLDIGLEGGDELRFGRHLEIALGHILGEGREVRLDHPEAVFVHRQLAPDREPDEAAQGDEIASLFILLKGDDAPRAADALDRGPFRRIGIAIRIVLYRLHHDARRG